MPLGDGHEDNESEQQEQRRAGAVHAGSEGIDRGFATLEVRRIMQTLSGFVELSVDTLTHDAVGGN